MGMTADDRAETRCGGVQVKGVDVVENVERESSHIDCCGFRQISGPIFPVHVPPDRVNRGNRPQFCENFRVAHISRMKNELSPLEGLERFKPNQAVSVGYDPYEVGMGSLGFSQHAIRFGLSNIAGATRRVPLRSEKY